MAVFPEGKGIMYNNLVVSNTPNALSVKNVSAD